MAGDAKAVGTHAFFVVREYRRARDSSDPEKIRKLEEILTARFRQYTS